MYTSVFSYTVYLVYAGYNSGPDTVRELYLQFANWFFEMYSSRTIHFLGYSSRTVPAFHAIRELTASSRTVYSSL